jgi:hypothetical protein
MLPASGDAPSDRPARNHGRVSDTPTALLDQARSYVGAEADRATALQTRASATVASAAVILSLTITVAKDLATHAVPLDLFRVIFALTLVTLFVAAVLAGIAFWPPASYAASVEEIEDYLSDETLTQGHPDTARALISSLHYELASTRGSNDARSKWLRRGLALLVLGALGTGVLGGTLGLSDKRHPARRSAGTTTVIRSDDPEPARIKPTQDRKHP